MNHVNKGALPASSMCCRLTRQSQPVQQRRPEKQKKLQIFSNMFWVCLAHLEVDVVAKDEPHAKHQLRGGKLCQPRTFCIVL